MKARVTSESQSFRLVERMAEARISHGQELRADLPNVRVLALAGVAEVQALFCNIGMIRVRTILNQGIDGSGNRRAERAADCESAVRI